MRHLIDLGIALYVFHCQSRRELNHRRKRQGFIDNINTLTNEEHETVAHTDTLNYLLVRMPDSALPVPSVW
jgi:hypothetical protein